MGDHNGVGFDPVIELDGVRVFHGDCRDVLAGLPDDSVDSIVTDPPYELGFMGKKWDASGIAYDLTVWGECLRVLKPGGHLLAFGGTRTWHRLAVAVEDAGFEIRDNIARFYGDSRLCQCEFPRIVEWSYGTGEPQTKHDVRSMQDSDLSEAVDARNERREVLQQGLSESSSQGTDRAKSSQRVADGAQSGVEGRGDLQASEGQLQGREVRSSTRMGETDGAEGRLHHGAPSGNGAKVRIFADSDRSSESQRPQSGKQQARESGVVSDERGPQAGGSWPFCVGCGKPMGAAENSHLAWVMGSGFPKSLDVSKAIDKKRDDCQEAAQVAAYLLKFNKFATVSQFREHLNVEIVGDKHSGGSAQGWTTSDCSGKVKAQVPTWQQWQKMKILLNLDDSMDAEVWRLNGRKGQPGEAWSEREVIGQKAWSNSANHFVPGDDHTKRVNLDETAPATDEAEKWAGWGTALKPAFEPIVVARKPLSGTVAETVLEWGTGGLNIDGSRIGSEQVVSRGGITSGSGNFVGGPNIVREPTVAQGRWPANVILDEYTADLLDQQSGMSKSPRGIVTQGGKDGGGFDIGSSNGTRRGEFQGHGDSGGASRFFYCAKASKRDRNEGLDNLPEQVGQRTHDGGEDTRGRPLPANRNIHPTVKPTALMRYLVKLVTPPGGTVLDPFTGSGSTGKAAVLEGFEFVGVELTDDYLPIIEGRLKWTIENQDEGTLF